MIFNRRRLPSILFLSFIACGATPPPAATHPAPCETAGVSSTTAAPQAGSPEAPPGATPPCGTTEPTAQPVASSEASSPPEPSTAPEPSSAPERRSVTEDAPTLLPPARGGWKILPPAVAEEEKHLDSAYRKLPKLDQLPDFLSFNDVIALHPEPDMHYSLREQLRSQLRGEQADVLFGGYWDDEDRWYLLWLRDEFLTQVAAVYDRGRRTHKQEFYRAIPLLRNVLTTKAERAGTDLPELIVQTITSSSVCCIPVDLEVYRLSPWGSLSKVLAFPKNQHEIGPGINWEFVNHFDFTGDNRLRIQQIFPEPSTEPYEFTYVEALGRYRASPETAARLRREQAAKAEEQY